MKLSISRLLELVGGHLVSGSDGVTVEGFSSLQEAGPSDLSFFHDPRYETHLTATAAGAVLVPLNWTAFPAASTCIAVADPSRAFEKIVEIWGVQPEPFLAGVHPSAVIAASAVFDPALVSIGPHAVIGEEVTLGAGTSIGAGCFIGRGAAIGAECRFFANVTVHSGSLLGNRVILHSGVVIGADGFGYEFIDGKHRKIRQAGMVQIDDDVEVGAGTMIDRARFGRTWIGAGTKIDNLVQIGHNAVIGRHCIIISGAAIAGSAVLGDHVTVAAQSGVAGHVKVGARSVLAGRTGVTKDLPGGEVYMGFPALPIGEERRRLAGIRRLPALVSRIKELEERLKKLESAAGQEPANHSA